MFSQTYISIWFFGYIVPFAIAHLVGKHLAEKVSFPSALMFAHAMLVLSVALSILLTGKQTSLQQLYTPNVLACLLILWCAYSTIWLGKIGPGYALSSLLQQGAMLTTASILFQGKVPLAWVILMIAPPYIWIHNWGGWTRAKFLLVSAWGITSLLLFWFCHSFWLNILCHTIGGSLAIHQGILLQKMAKKEP